MQKDCLSTCVLRQSLMDIKGAPANHFFQLPDGYPLSRYFLILFLCSLQQLPNLTFSFSVISDLDQSNRTVILLMNSFTLIATCFITLVQPVVRFPHFYGALSRLGAFLYSGACLYSITLTTNVKWFCTYFLSIRSDFCANRTKRFAFEMFTQACSDFHE